MAEAPIRRAISLVSPCKSVTRGSVPVNVHYKYRNILRGAFREIEGSPRPQATCGFSRMPPVLNSIDGLVCFTQFP